MLSLTPILVFLIVYLVSSLVAGDFYAVPVSSAFLIACIYALCIGKGTVRQRIDVFSKGAGNRNVLLMIWIFILAGAFAGTAHDMGAIDATVGAALRFIPPKMMYAGLFITACFISLSIGTSVGTIVALMPIGTGIAAQTGIGAEYIAGIIVGGSLFGDNLSFISDTTIASTQAVGAEMKDKFRANIGIIAPAFVIVTIIYLIQGSSVTAVSDIPDVNVVKMIPYLLVIILALCGRNVSVILVLGILANAVIGFAYGSFTWPEFLGSVGKGVSGMSDLIIVTLLAGGLLATIKDGGGIDFIVNKLTKRINGPRMAQGSIAALVALADVCTANNTIAIITTGGIARDIAEKFGITSRRAASLLDTFSCFVQGILPYGAQLLMAAGLAGIAPTRIIHYLYYPFIMGIFAIGAILLSGKSAKTTR